MTAELLRRAAKEMRDRATQKAVPETRWYVKDDGYDFHVLAPDPTFPGLPWDVARDLPGGGDADERSPLAEYIASWHPAVALAVADWLEARARDMASGGFDDPYAIAVARVYLGETS